MHTRHKRLARHTILCGIVRLNIGGREYVTSKSTLQMDPEGMLATMISGRVPSAKINDAYFIDRDPDLFCYVLEFLRTGHVELPNSEGSWRRLEREADFFMLPSLQQLIRSKLLETFLEVKLYMHYFNCSDKQCRCGDGGVKFELVTDDEIHTIYESQRDFLGYPKELIEPGFASPTTTVHINLKMQTM